jgi:hypothetical protein
LSPGRHCPLAYRYAPQVFAREADLSAASVYVIGGLYGNLPALDAIESLAARETTPPTLIFNGDFNWFNRDLADFVALNRRVLAHTALRGNVETELANPDTNDNAGCGCAYPESVSAAEVERSNQIFTTLRETARTAPEQVAALAALPMHLVVAVGDARVGVVHGDAESLAGWRFAEDQLYEPRNHAWLTEVCEAANLVGFASSHTCLPALRTFSRAPKHYWLANNGAAGMPNFSNTQYGLLTRIATTPAVEGTSQFGHHDGALFIDALPIHYDVGAFQAQFNRSWPPESPAALSYAKRICEGPDYQAAHALGQLRTRARC